MKPLLSSRAILHTIADHSAILLPLAICSYSLSDKPSVKPPGSRSDCSCRQCTPGTLISRALVKLLQSGAVWTTPEVAACLRPTLACFRTNTSYSLPSLRSHGGATRMPMNIPDLPGDGVGESPELTPGAASSFLAPSGFFPCNLAFVRKVDRSGGPSQPVLKLLDLLHVAG